jgi:hypothetical protein
VGSAKTGKLPSEAATEIVENRQGVYGHPGQVYGIWAYMIQPVIARLVAESRTLPTAEECSMLLILLKCAREVNSNYPEDYRDNLDDIAGYANVLYMTKEYDGSR